MFCIDSMGVNSCSALILWASILVLHWLYWHQFLFCVDSMGFNSCSALTLWASILVLHWFYGHQFLFCIDSMGINLCATRRQDSQHGKLCISKFGTLNWKKMAKNKYFLFIIDLIKRFVDPDPAKRIESDWICIQIRNPADTYTNLVQLSL